MWLGTPAPFARGLSLATKAQACAGQARSANGLTFLAASLNRRPAGVGGHLAPASCPSHGVTLEHVQHRLPKFPSVIEPASFLCLTSPLLLRSPLDNPLAHKPCLRVTPGGPSPGEEVPNLYRKPIGSCVE